MQQTQITLAMAISLVSVASASRQPQAELVLHFVQIGQGDCLGISGAARSRRYTTRPAAGMLKSLEFRGSAGLTE